MRILVFLLILANLLFYAWTHDYLGLSRDPDAARVGQQLRADDIRIVSNDEPPPETGRKDKTAKAPEPPPAETCALVGEMPLPEVEALEKALAEKLPAFKAMRVATTPGSSSYWVYIPPLKSKREADNKAAELKKLGVKEYFVVQESGANNLAISLGLFSTEEGANSALDALRDKGVRSARVVERPGKAAQAQLEIRGPEAQAEQLREALGQVRAGACKARSAAAQ